MKMFLVDVVNNKAEVVEVEPKLDNYYKLLNCSTIDIPSRQVGGKYFDIICDDEGLLCDSPVPSAVNNKKQIMLVGNLLFCNHDGEGNEVGLSDNDIKLIQNRIGYCVKEKNGEVVYQPIVIGLEY